MSDNILVNLVFYMDSEISCNNYMIPIDKLVNNGITLEDNDYSGISEQLDILYIVIGTNCLNMTTEEAEAIINVMSYNVPNLEDIMSRLGIFSDNQISSDSKIENIVQVHNFGLNIDNLCLAFEQ